MTQKDRKGPNWPQMTKTVPKWPKWPKRTKMTQNDQNDQDHPKCNYGAKCPPHSCTLGQLWLWPRLPIFLNFGYVIDASIMRGPFFDWTVSGCSFARIKFWGKIFKVFALYWKVCKSNKKGNPSGKIPLTRSQENENKEFPPEKSCIYNFCILSKYAHWSSASAGAWILEIGVSRAEWFKMTKIDPNWPKMDEFTKMTQLGLRMTQPWPQYDPKMTRNDPNDPKWPTSP